MHEKVSILINSISAFIFDLSTLSSEKKSGFIKFFMDLKVAKSADEIIKCYSPLYYLLSICNLAFSCRIIASKPSLVSQIINLY